MDEALKTVNANDMRVIEGEISEINVHFESQNLHDQISIFGNTLKWQGALGAVLGSVSSIANTFMVSRFTTYSVDVLTCRIGGKSIKGVFSGSGLLRNGEHVRAVVAQQGDTLYAFAIQRPDDELLWLPLYTSAGSVALIKVLLKFALFLYVGNLILFGLFTWYSDGPIIIMKWLAEYTFPFSVFIVLISQAKLLRRTVLAEKIFTLLGFPDVKNLAMIPGTFTKFHDRANLDHADYKAVFYYQRVIDAHLAGKRVKAVELPDLPNWDQRWRR